MVSLDCSGRRSEGEEQGLGDNLLLPVARVAGSGTEQGWGGGVGTDGEGGAGSDVLGP